MLCNYVKYIKAGIDLRHFGHLKDLLILIWSRGTDDVEEQCLRVERREHFASVGHHGLGLLADPSFLQRQVIQTAHPAKYVKRSGTEGLLVEFLPVFLDC